MGLFDLFGKKNSQSNALQYRYQYQPQQDAAVEQFIEQNFGPIDAKVHDICGDLIKVDLCFISPNDHNPSYLLVTKGLGAYLMAMSDYNDPAANLSRVELVLDSGEPWEIGFGDNRDYWAQELCAALAQQIVNNGLNLNTGVLNLNNLGINIPDCAQSFLVTTPDHYDAYQNFASSVALNNGQVSFLLLVDQENDEPTADIPGEQQASTQQSAAPQSAAEHGVAEHSADNSLSFDNVDDLVALAEKNGIDPINAYNRAAFFVRWALENNLISSKYQASLQGDIRSYLQANLKDLDKEQFFTKEGLDFVNSYYDVEEGVCANYIDDILNFVSQHTDSQEYSCLSLEYNDSSYEELAECIDDVYDSFLEQVEYDNSEDAELYEVAKGLLNTDCVYFAPTNDDIHLASVYSYAYENNDEHSAPIIMELDYNYIKGLINYLCPNSCRMDSFDYDPNEAMNSVRQALAEADSCLDQAPEILSRLMESNLEDLQNNGGSLDELMGDLESAQQKRANTPETFSHKAFEFDTYWRGDTAVNPNNNKEEEITKATLFTNLPVDSYYKMLAYLPFVPSNCGMTLPEMMAVLAYFEQRYEAYVAVVSVDTIEFNVDCVLSEQEAMEAAKDLYAFTPYALDMCEVSDPTLADLAAYLMENQVWTCKFDINEDGDYGTNNEEQEQDSAFSF